MRERHCGSFFGCRSCWILFSCDDAVVVVVVVVVVVAAAVVAVQVQLRTQGSPLLHHSRNDTAPTWDKTTTASHTFDIANGIFHGIRQQQLHSHSI